MPDYKQNLNVALTALDDALSLPHDRHTHDLVLALKDQIMSSDGVIQACRGSGALPAQTLDEQSFALADAFTAALLHDASAQALLDEALRLSAGWFSLAAAAQGAQLRFDNQGLVVPAAVRGVVGRMPRPTRSFDDGDGGDGASSDGDGEPADCGIVGKWPK